ncbi:MAG: ATP-dependent zinc metalloprotease FtsH [Acidimicrobiales bacterium]|nr:ATP-dependent zinc metalloprotease FtsH [Acidimicrobiales bacterium]
MAPDSPPPPPPPPPSPNRRGPGANRIDPGWPRWALWLALGTLTLIVVISLTAPGNNGDTITYNQFLDAVAAGDVESVEINTENGKVVGVFDDGEKFNTVGPDELSADDIDARFGDRVEVTLVRPEPGLLAQWLPLILFFGLFFLLMIYLQRRAQGQMSGIMNVGKSKAKTHSSEMPGTTFDDVAGYAGVKQEITEVVDFLRRPEKYGSIGARTPKGVLLVGPPGTGKTLIARAVAGEAGVPFLSVTGSDFMEMFVGVGASRVRDLFETARKHGRAIIFVDEIDSIGRKRGAGLGGGHDEREQTLNQMLSEMDGFEASEGIVMMAATNRPDILDSALLRPGRFDRQVVVPLPELEDRRAILSVHIKGKKIAEDVDLDVVSRGSPGMSGADLANLVNEAALFAVREGADHVFMRHFEQARDRIIIGQKRDSMVMSDQEKELTAYHEAGHAVCAVVQPNADPLHKVTIIPTGMALGVTMQLPAEDRHGYQQDYLRDRLVVMMGGRVSEQLVYDQVSTGAKGDLVSATQMAHAMVSEWGMSDQVGPMAWGNNEQVFLGDGLMASREYSDEMAHVIDEETQRILREEEERCRQTLTRHRKALDLVARSLLEHETISGEEVERLIKVADEVPPLADPTTVPAPPPPPPDMATHPDPRDR